MAASNGTADRRIESLIGNVMSMRREFFSRFLDPRRDVYDECGYPKVGEPTYQTYQDLYEREAVPARVVECLPRESWQVTPLVYESEDADVITPFEQAWDALGATLRGRSWYQDEEGSVVWEYLRRADELSGIGQYGVILLGLDDGADLRDEAKPGRKLLFLRVFPESLAQVVQSETDPTNPRFGQPTAYNITFNDPSVQSSGIGVTTATAQVHWTRVVHIADNLGSSEVYGTPRMRPVLNNLLGLQKLYCGSPEMYWRGAFPGISLETHPQLGGDVDVDVSKTRDFMEEYMNGLQRYLLLMGMSAKTLAPTVVDPTPQIDAQITAICIKLGIPKRVFMGSERGELASSQDDQAWNDRLRERQGKYLTPRVVVPFVDRLIGLGVLPEPVGYSVEWPDLTSQSDAEKATVAATRTGALAQYVQGGVENLIPPLDYLTRFLGLTEEEAAAILDNAEGAGLDAEAAETAGVPEEPEPEEEEEPTAAPAVPVAARRVENAAVKYLRFRDGIEGRATA